MAKSHNKSTTHRQNAFKKPTHRAVKTHQRDIFEWFEEQSRKKQIILATGIGVLLFLSTVVLAQFLYPVGRVLPGVRLQGSIIGIPTARQLQRSLQHEYKDATVEVKLSDATRKASLKEIGMEVAPEVTAQRVTEYPFWQRLIPFSSLAIMATRDTNMWMYRDDVRVKDFALEVSEKFVLPARNATVTVKNGKIELSRAQPSRTFPAERIVSALYAEPLSPRMTVTVKPDTTKAVRSDEAVKEVLASAQKVAARKLTLYAGSEHFTVEGKIIASWLEFPEDDKGNVTMHVNTQKLQAYVESLSPQVYKEPGTTKVTLVDGVETARTPGESGRGLDVARAAEKINQALTQGSNAPIDLGVQTLEPKVVYDRQYTGSNAGLMNLLQSIQNRRGYSIVVKELGGGGRSASVGGDKTWYTASIYKALVAYVVLKQIGTGQLTWSQPVMAGRDLSECFEMMIVYSDNTCGTYVGNLVGRETTQNELHAIGMTSTFFDGERRTTADDLALFFRKLQDGSILQGAARDKLVNAMTRQIYRNAIPYGVGWPTANKVGHQSNQLHDAAIVYGPEGPYILIIMSDGSSWGSISATAREIQNFLYP